MTEIPRCFEGGAVVCIGGGPSMTMEDVEYCQMVRIPAIAVNNAYHLAPWASILYAADDIWWRHHIRDVDAKFHGQRWTQSITAAKEFGLNHIILSDLPGLSDDPNTIHSGGNSGYQALNIAYLTGAVRIVLLGYDCQRTNGMDHWFGKHPGNLNQGMDFDDWIEAFRSAAAHLRMADVGVVNASRQTALDCFVRQPIQRAFK